MIDQKNLFDEPVKIDLGNYNNRKIESGQSEDYRYLLNYPYFKKYYKMIAIDLSKQQGLDAALKAIQQISFKGNQDLAENKIMLFII